MFLLDDQLHWSASDLAAAAECEYAFLRRLDDKLGRAERVLPADDPLQAHIARLGEAHEGRLLDDLQAASNVAEMEHLAGPFTTDALDDARTKTLAAFASSADVVYQATFSDGEFFGYADFVERAEDGWRVCDAKLARSAKPKALIQLGAYADQLQRAGLPVSSTVSLLLGDGQRVDFPLVDVLPVFEERRDRLRQLIAEHLTEDSAVAWGDDRYLACGRCPDCDQAVNDTGDVILVAGLRMEQRKKLRAAGITTVSELAAATAKPAGMATGTFDSLRAQAVLQLQQMASGDVSYELTAGAGEALPKLPAPSPGDLFFDFEGDPLYDEGDPSRVGLEYLWGVLDTDEHYTARWAHSWAEERAAFVAFMDDVAARRATHPDMHIYHYAPYETTALKRLAMRYQTREKELDDLLRSQVFVDLYATVRAAVRVSQPSYSIKKLEPLYMGDQLRESDVADGAGSIAAYVEYREMRAADPAGAAHRLESLADYNEYDCLSTLRLRDWLLERADEAEVGDEVVKREKDTKGDELSVDDPVFIALMERSGPERRTERTAEEQAYAMLATALDYYRREGKQFWWGHFDRLAHPVADWAETRDVFVVESAKVISDWAKPEGKATNHRRTVRLVGYWTPGSKPGGKPMVVRPAPPSSGEADEDVALYAAKDATDMTIHPDDPRAVTVIESVKPADIYSELPVALAPGSPPPVKSIEAALRDVGERALDTPDLPRTAGLDLLARRAPRLSGSATSLPHTGSTIDDIVGALLAVDSSYVAVQGPPGTGKTYSGSRVIKRLVEDHGWRVGVVAQSHAVVENMLSGVIKARLDPDLVAKRKTKTDDPPWVALDKLEPFLAGHAESGCVVGGTVWDFTNEGQVPRDSLDLLVVDEAGQFALAPTLAASLSAQRLLLLGDPQQLPQVSQGVHAEPVDESALGWIMEDHETLPAEYGYFLAETYRMHPDVCRKVSMLSYDGELVSAPAASQRQLEQMEPGVSVVEVPHTGNRTLSVEEADEVVAQVRAHLGLTWTDPENSASPRPIGEGDVLVVAPYNAQVVCIREALEAAGLGAVRVGTVDKFQGQEAPVVLVSMTASSHGDVPRGMGFLLSRNRINVAVSRAQWRTVIIRSEALTSYMPSSVQGLLELGAFIGLCQSLGTGHEAFELHRRCRVRAGEQSDTC